LSVFPNARNVVPGDREYDFMHRLWVKNQKPFQFDWEGKEGGFIAYVYERDLEQPTFHIHSEAGPTLLDETAPGGPMTLGFELLMAARGQIRYTAPSHNRRGRVVKVPLPMQRSNL
jgi:hypothetical protein